MARERIPVVGHLGLVPRHVTWTGYRAVGKTVDEARELVRLIAAADADAAVVIGIVMSAGILALTGGETAGSCATGNPPQRAGDRHQAAALPAPDHNGSKV